MRRIRDRRPSPADPVSQFPFPRLHSPHRVHSAHRPSLTCLSRFASPSSPNLGGGSPGGQSHCAPPARAARLTAAWIASSPTMSLIFLSRHGALNEWSVERTIRSISKGERSRASAPSSIFCSERTSLRMCVTTPPEEEGSGQTRREARTDRWTGTRADAVSAGMNNCRGHQPALSPSAHRTLPSRHSPSPSLPFPSRTDSAR